MLKYLVDTSMQLLNVMLLMGVIFGFLKAAYGEKIRNRARIFICAGIIFALAMAVMKTTTSRIDTGMWNLYFYEISAGLSILFIIAFWLPKTLGKLLSTLSLGLILCIQLLYSLTDVFVYPHTIMLTEDSVISTNFLTKMAGVVLGLLLTIVLALAAKGISSYFQRKGAYALLVLLLLIQSFKQVTASFSTMLARRMIPNNHTLFQLAKFSSNQSNLFLYMSLVVVAAAALILLVRSYTAKIIGENPAQIRKARFHWKVARRWSICFLICAVITVLLMTVVYQIANKEVELSPVEETNIDDTAMYISFEQLSDGHLHRFGYTTPSGTVIRVIAIQKPNSNAYGIGLDACDICGETGYYEKDGQVVCNLCDVVMNINTIGFKGGCNPIVIDYSIENGNIVIPLEGLLEHEKIFK